MNEVIMWLELADRRFSIEIPQCDHPIMGSYIYIGVVLSGT